ERRKVFLRRGAEITAGTFDPEHLDSLPVERVLFRELGRRVAAAGVGDALVSAKFIRAINETINAGILAGIAIIPEVADVSVSFLTHKIFVCKRRTSGTGSLRAGHTACGGVPGPAQGREHLAHREKGVVAMIF